MSHLAFYREHGISPVAYAGTSKEHFERRASLYRSLRLPPVAFRGAKVLEIASGTGQNAEYLASLNPSCLELVEPYPARWTSQIPVKVMTLERYEPPRAFDIVICENWLGLQELPLLAKLASMVAPNGVLVLTCVHPLGIYPNVLRRKIAARLIARTGMSFQEKTKLLVRAFETHLATLKDMTRSAEDWVQDMLLNPAVEHIGVTFPMLISRLDAQFVILGTSPEFRTDWRWFKSLHGEARQFNDAALFDYFNHDKEFANYLDADSNPGLIEAQDLLGREQFSAEDVRQMGPFRALFGRETIYASFQRC